MQPSIQTIQYTRAFVLSLIEGLTTAQLNAIPQGFNNSIAWNIGHLIAAQQGVCYKRPGLPLAVDEAIFEAYKPGSKPEVPVGEAEIAQLKGLLFTSLDRLQEDYDAHLFSDYNPWTTRYGNEVKGIDDAIDFLVFHEGMHTGIIMAMKKLVAA